MSTRGIGGAADCGCRASASGASCEGTSVNGFPDDEMLGCMGVKPLEVRSFAPVDRGAMVRGNDGKLELSPSSEDESKWKDLPAATRQKR